MRDLSKRVRDALGQPEVVAPLVLCVLFPLWGQHGRAPIDWDALFGTGGDPYAGPMLDFAWAALVCFAVPVAVVRLWLRAPLADYGLGLGDLGLGWKVLLVGVVVGLPAMYLASRDPAMRAVYPRFGDPTPAPSAGRFALWAAAYALFFLAGEMSMRGFLLFALEKRGAAMAVAVTTLVQTAWHLGAPAGELATAPLWGLIVGGLNLRLRSIWYGFAVHWSMNVFLDALIAYDIG